MEHTAEVTAVLFSPVNSTRAFSASIDKTFKVYEIPTKCVLKNIVTASPVHKMLVDNTETNVYVACEN